MLKGNQICGLLLTGITAISLLLCTLSKASNRAVVFPLDSSYWVIPITDSTVTTVTSSTGRFWMDRNLGASRVATSATDSSAYGYCYQWGRLSDGHQDRLSEVTDYNATSSEDIPGHSKFIIANSDWRNPSNNDLWQGLEGTSNPCPQGFRVPTNVEWNAEIDTWQNKNSTGAFDSPLKLVVAGTRARNNGVYFGEDSSGHYWSSDIAATGAYYFSFDSFAGENSTYRAYGKSVRCIQN